MERHVDELLGALKTQLVKMSALTERMIADALKMLVDRDESVIAAVRQHEEQVNLMQMDIDETCLSLIALHQPTAGDLRFILGAAKTNAELERLGDQAVNVCQKAARLLREPPLKPSARLPRMAILASGMLKDSLHAFVNRDVQKARDVLKRDDELDALKRDITAELVALMRQDADLIARAMDLALVARNLERIGDHATNIAENTIFVVEGRDVRHHVDECKRGAATLLKVWPS
jgi:phosphate transport system protein